MKLKKTCTYESPLGTHMFFEDDPFAQTNDPLFDKLPEKNLKYINKSRKTIKAEHVYVKAKEENEQEQQQPVDKQNDIKPVTFSSIAEAVEKFKKDWKRSYPDIFNDNKE
ncbi:unnamed protein product [Leptosia nina]|uniref:Transcription factor TFIIIC triple barrel domain-containing protein n=1 Tax=Leptosia nina TaxID=320188 RepID=A0AAV1JII4_9NEOP